MAWKFPHPNQEQARAIIAVITAAVIMIITGISIYTVVTRSGPDFWQTGASHVLVAWVAGVIGYIIGRAV